MGRAEYVMLLSHSYKWVRWRLVVVCGGFSKYKYTIPPYTHKPVNLYV